MAHYIFINFILFKIEVLVEYSVQYFPSTSTYVLNIIVYFNFVLIVEGAFFEN